MWQARTQEGHPTPTQSSLLLGLHDILHPLPPLPIFLFLSFFLSQLFLSFFSSCFHLRLWVMNEGLSRRGICNQTWLPTSTWKQIDGINGVVVAAASIHFEAGVVDESNERKNERFQGAAKSQVHRRARFKKKLLNAMVLRRRSRSWCGGWNGGCFSGFAGTREWLDWKGN